MNETVIKFGYPESLVHEYDHWVVLVRPVQITIGSIVLAAKSQATCIHEVPRDAFTELKDVTTDIETMLKHVFDYDKINYLALMMIDNEVHFHVVPRYAGIVTFNGD